MNTFEKLYKEDQKNISLWEKKYTDKEFYKLNYSIRIRLNKLIKKKKNLSGKENFICAIIYHHAFNISSSKKALNYIKKTQQLKYKKQKWLIASIKDRLLQLQGLPQRYGTQIVNLKNGKIKQYKVDKSITDKERINLGLPKLKDLKKALES